MLWLLVLMDILSFHCHRQAFHLGVIVSRIENLFLMCVLERERVLLAQDMLQFFLLVDGWVNLGYTLLDAQARVARTVFYLHFTSNAIMVLIFGHFFKFENLADSFALI